MRKAMLLAALVGIFAMVAFNGCGAGAATTVIKQQLDEILTKLNDIEMNNGKLQVKVDQLEKTINDLKTAHPELFEKAEEKPAGQTATKPKTETKTEKKTGGKKGKGGRVK